MSERIERPVTTGKGKNLQVKETRVVEIDYVDLEEALVRLQQAGEGLTQCSVELFHEEDGYMGCTRRVEVCGWRPATTEDRAAIRAYETQQDEQGQKLLSYQIKALQKAGYKVVKEGKNE